MRENTKKNLPSSFLVVGIWAPYKYEKFEFRKNFVTMLLSVESGPENRIFEIFCPHDFRKMLNEISNLEVVIYL